MKILATNDDGISAPGLLALATGLTGIAQVVVVAPDREASASGTAVTLAQPLRVRKERFLVAGVDTYSVEGTPSDAVILALEKLTSGVDLVISGINQGLNLGDDTLISGTVGAALQGYLRSLPAIAISSATAQKPHLDSAARLAMLLAQGVSSGALPADIFLSVNLPDLPLAKIKGLKLVRPAHKTHIDTVAEGHDGRRRYYWLKRRKLERDADTDTDIQAIEQGYISITTLNAILFQKPQFSAGDSPWAGLFRELKQTI
jgi:5'-nucleotidase